MQRAGFETSANGKHTVGCHHGLKEHDLEEKKSAGAPQYMAGGDLRAALDKDARRELVWERKGQQVALDIARGIHFLHSHDVRVPCAPWAPLG